MNKTICAFLFVVIAFCLGSCSSNDDYMNVIPKKSAMVVSVDLKEMAQKSDINDKDGEALKSRISNFLKSGLTGRAYKIAEDIIDDPSNSGLALGKKVFVFSSSGFNTLGVVAKVDDDGDLEDFINSLHDNNICSALKEEDDCKWTKIGNGICAFNDDTFLLLMQKVGDPNELKDALLTLMHQKKEDSYSNSDEFKKLLKSKGELSMVMNSSVLPDYISLQLRMGMPTDIRLDEIKYLISTNFEKGRIVINSASIISNKNIEDTFEENERLFSTINGKLLKNYPTKTIVWVGANVKGEQFYNMLCQNKSIQRTLNNPFIPINSKLIFSAINGDISIGYFDEKHYLALAQVTNESFLKTVENLRPLVAMSGGSVILKKISASEYEFHMDDTNLWFGVRNNLLYITNNEEYVKYAAESNGNSLTESPWVNDMKGSRYFAALSMTSLIEYASHSQNPSISVIAPFLGFCEYADFMSPNWKSCKMNIVMKDKKINALQVLVRELQNL